MWLWFVCISCLGIVQLVNCTKALRQGWNPVLTPLTKLCVIAWCCIHPDSFYLHRNYISCQSLHPNWAGPAQRRMPLSNSYISKQCRQAKSGQDPLFSLFRKKYSSWSLDPRSAAICRGFVCGNSNLKREMKHVYLDSNFAEERYPVYIHRLLDSISLYVKKDPILTLNLTESLRIVFSEVLNNSLQVFTFLGVFTGFKGRITHARIFMNHEI